MEPVSRNQDHAEGGFSSTSQSGYEVSLTHEYSDGSENRFEVEITSLVGVIDHGMALKDELTVVVTTFPDGREVHVPDLGIWESGDSYAEAIENVIAFVSSDFAFLNEADARSLTQDAIDRLRKYRRFIV